MASKINNIIVFDVETGGLDSLVNPITQIALQAFSLKDFKEVCRYSSYVKPSYNQEYDDKALAYTGITLTKLEKEGKPITQVVKELCQFFLQANQSGSKTHKPVLLGHNVLFDIGFLQAAFAYCNTDLQKYIMCQEKGFNKGMPVYFDTMWDSKRRFADDDIKYSLKDVCSLVGVDLVDAHDAFNDVKATKELFIKHSQNLRSGSSSQSVESSHKRIEFEF